MFFTIFWVGVGMVLVTKNRLFLLQLFQENRSITLIGYSRNFHLVLPLIRENLKMLSHGKKETSQVKYDSPKREDV